MSQSIFDWSLTLLFVVIGCCALATTVWMAVTAFRTGKIIPYIIAVVLLIAGIITVVAGIHGFVYLSGATSVFPTRRSMW